MTVIKRITFFTFGVFPLFAQPSGMQCTHGTAHTHHHSANHLQIKTSDRAIIKWDQFSIDKHEITEFVQPGKNSAVLNRVIGGNASHLLGSLQANGQVFVLNPAGILIGKDARIDTASFIASTFDVLDSEFLKGSDMTFFGNSKEPLINLGTIRAFDQDIILLAHQIQNEGRLSAPSGTVALGCGHEILLKMNDKEKIFIRPSQGEKSETGIENRGQIEALTAELKADGNLYALAIKDSGMIEATGIAEKNGRIYLVAEKGSIKTSSQLIAKNEDKTGGTIHILGDQLLIKDQTSLDASGDFAGGEILIGGDFQGKNPLISNATFTGIEEGAKINADCNIEGKGGKVIVWSDHTTRYYGNLSAQGGREGGDGGFAEISGSYLDFAGPVNLLSSRGNHGQLLLDPNVVTISTAGQTSGVVLACPTTLPEGESNINSTNLKNALQGGNVCITTTAGGNFSGDITMTAFDNSWNTNTTLELNAAGTILIDNVTLDPSGGGKLSLIAANDILVNPNPSTNFINFVNFISQTLTLDAGGNITIGGNRFQCAGPISLTAGADINIQSNVSGGTVFNPAITVSAKAGGDINLFGPSGSLRNSGGSIEITAGGALTLNTVADEVTSSNVISAQTDVTITAQSVNINGSSKSAPVTVGITAIAGNLTMNVGEGGVTLLAERGGAAYITGLLPMRFSILGPLSLIGFTYVLGGSQLNVTASGINVIGSRTSFNGNALLESLGNMILTCNAGVQDLVQVIGGNATNSNASIAVLNPMRSLTLNTPNCDLDLKGGFGTSSRAFISTESGPININSSGTAGGNLVLQGGGGTTCDATILARGESLTANFSSEIVLAGGTGISNGSANLVADGNISLSGNSIELVGGGGVGNNIAEILSNAGSVSITGTGSMELVGHNNSIINQRVAITAVSGTSIEMGGAITMAGNSLIETQTGDLLMIAGTDISLGERAQIKNLGAGAITLVVDNLFPTSPFFGPGSFTSLNSTITPEGGGPLRIFTSVRLQNTIAGQLNGQTFSPGRIYEDSSTEQWGVYYPSTIYGGEKYMLFYKDFSSNPSILLPFPASCYRIEPLCGKSSSKRRKNFLDFLNGL
jgi:filamentous hemagglutinin family protein